MSVISQAVSAIRAEKDEPPPVAPPTPNVIEPERVVTEDALPRGPMAVANVADGFTWSLTWLKSETERLARPKRGGVAYGLRFAEHDGKRVGWAVWIAGAFAGAFVYPSPRAIVPRKLSAAELKDLLA